MRWFFLIFASGVFAADVDINALFLGPKSENQNSFKSFLEFTIDDYIYWRKNFHPEDPEVITRSDREKQEFIDTIKKNYDVLFDLTNRLKAHSVPFFSPRYLGHMLTDTLMPANLGYIAAILYNPNNCTEEASPVTTELEFEVGKQLAKLFGFNSKKAWGHITSGGTVANFEAVWVARNSKTFPLAVKQVLPELVSGMDDWALLNMPFPKILDLIDLVKKRGQLEEVKKRATGGAGVKIAELGKILVPQTKHYCWEKAADIFGIGEENLVNIRVKENFRMDTSHLRDTIDALVKEKIPILAVVGVLGSTEEGAVDPIDEIVSLRKEYEKKGISFYIHVDAAYGGYARSLFLDEEDRFMDYATLTRKLHQVLKILPEKLDWPSLEIYRAFQALKEVDSITVDPHKMGYVPYPAGAITMRDRRVLDLISYTGAYISDEMEMNSLNLGSYILEGSKPGAAVAGVWTANQVVPLNCLGYGKIIGNSIVGANKFYDSLLSFPPMEIKGKKIKVAPLFHPDLNIIDFVFYEEGNTSLQDMNAMNQKIYKIYSPKKDLSYSEEFLFSKTILDYENYGDSPKKFLEKLGIPGKEWEKEHKLFVLRSCILNPFLAKTSTYEEFFQLFLESLKEHLKFIE